MTSEPEAPGSRGSRRAHAAPGLDGIIVVAKPAGPTSHDVVAIVRRLTGVRRVGHGGTLDPFASGVLPIFLGHATRMVEYHLGDAKAYRAVVVFGARSTTDDRDGEITPVDGPAPDRDVVAAALPGFLGPIVQVPPDHSAVRVAGRHAYELARHGQKPELRPRAVTIHALELVDWDERDRERPAATIEVRCSAGTYIRALARDLGEALGNGAYLGDLVRTASGPFRLESAHALDRVRERLAVGAAVELLLPPDTGLEEVPSVRLDGDDLAALLRGQVVRHRLPVGATPGPGRAEPGEADDGIRRVLDGAGQLVAMARLEHGRLHPDKVFRASPA